MRLLGRHLECLLVLGAEESVLSKVFGRSSDDRLFARVIVVELGYQTSIAEVLLNLLSRFALLQSYRQAACARANTLHVVLVHFGTNHVADPGELLDVKLTALGWQSRHIDVNNFTLIWVVLHSLVRLVSVDAVDI